MSHWIILRWKNIKLSSNDTCSYLSQRQLNKTVAYNCVLDDVLLLQNKLFSIQILLDIRKNLSEMV